MRLFLVFAVCFVWFLEARAEDRQHHAHRHHLSVILGGTTVPEADHTGLTYGVDYEYVLNRRFGVGAIVERAEGAIDATSLIAVIDVHVTDRLVLQAGPGIELEGGEAIAIGRFGAYYEFDVETPFGHLSLAPSLSYDLSEKDDALVYGLLLGKKF